MWATDQKFLQGESQLPRSEIKEAEMRVEITARSLELTDTMKERMEQRLLKFKRYFNGVMDCHVYGSQERFVYKFEMTLHGNGFNLFAEAHDEDLHAAFESAADKMERQIRKLKDKIRRRRPRRPEAPVSETAESDEVEDFSEEIEST
jgi:putative sigma-54 modulation protein